MVERRIPNPMVGGSSPSWPATKFFLIRFTSSLIKENFFYKLKNNITWSQLWINSKHIIRTVKKNYLK